VDALAASGSLEASGSRLFEGFPWAGLARLLDRDWDLDNLRTHHLQLLAAARMRELGLPVPLELVEEARRAQLSHLVARALLVRVREICSGPLLVLKGAEVAARYPASDLRPFIDVDVLAPDADAVNRELRRAGFVGVGAELDWDSLHHVRRLAIPDLPISIEVHRRPKWVAGLAEPRVDELFAQAVPSATGIAGLLTPAPAVHAVLLAAHAWAERPLGRIGDLVDVTAMTENSDASAAEIARYFGIERVWRTTVAAADALLGDGQATWPLGVWARHLPRMREQTVLESHLRRLLAPCAALPFGSALREAAYAVARTTTPAPNEGWGDKLARMRRAIRHPLVSRSEHERRLSGRGEDRR
jgi:hypothetical protein